MDERLPLSEAYAARPSRTLMLRRVLGRDWASGYLFVLPMVLIMGGLIFWPFISAIFTSTTSFNLVTGETFYVGLKNYQRLLTNSDYHQAILNTAVFTFWSLLIKFIVGMIVALLLN